MILYRARYSVVGQSKKVKVTLIDLDTYSFIQGLLFVRIFHICTKYENSSTHCIAFIGNV